MSNGLSMTAADVANWARVHQRAGSFWSIAADDYVGARCCILNGLFTGFVLGAQAAEKYLKAYLLCQGTRQGPRHRLGKHDLERQLAAAASTLAGLAKFADLMTTLSRAYARRYPGPVQLGTLTGGDLDQLDEMVVLILENVKMPDEVKFRMSPFFLLFDENARRAPWMYRTWLTTQNAALATKLTSWEHRYREVLDHLHPSR